MACVVGKETVNCLLSSSIARLFLHRFAKPMEKIFKSKKEGIWWEEMRVRRLEKPSHAF